MTKNRQINTTGLTDKEALIAKNCVNAILHGKSMLEVMDAWAQAQKSSPKVVYAVYRAVGDVMTNVITGRDSRFLTEDLRKYLDHVKSVSAQ